MFNRAYSSASFLKKLSSLRALDLTERQHERQLVVCVGAVERSSVTFALRCHASVKGLHRAQRPLIEVLYIFQLIASHDIPRVRHPRHIVQLEFQPDKRYTICRTHIIRSRPVFIAGLADHLHFTLATVVKFRRAINTRILVPGDLLTLLVRF